MSIVGEYERNDWDAQGGWRGVEDYVDCVVLLFADDDELDDLEETPEVRTERPLDDDGRMFVTVARRRCYRAFSREGAYTWQLDESGERDFTETLIVG